MRRELAWVDEDTSGTTGEGKKHATRQNKEMTSPRFKGFNGLTFKILNENVNLTAVLTRATRDGAAQAAASLGGSRDLCSPRRWTGGRKDPWERGVGGMGSRPASASFGKGHVGRAASEWSSKVAVGFGRDPGAVGSLRTLGNCRKCPGLRNTSQNETMGRYTVGNQPRNEKNSALCSKNANGTAPTAATPPKLQEILLQSSKCTPQPPLQATAPKS
eukprot:Gb_34760 [translate_table: standard]